MPPVEEPTGYAGVLPNRQVQPALPGYILAGERNNFCEWPGFPYGQWPQN